MECGSLLPLSLLAACCPLLAPYVAERWNRLFPKARMTEAQQADRIRSWLAQDGKIANMRERLASVSSSL